MATEQAKQAKAPCNHPKLGPIWVNVHSEDGKVPLGLIELCASLIIHPPDISKLPSRILKSTDRPRVAVTREYLIILARFLDPDEHVPKVIPHTGMMEQWGIAEDYG